tara:strand:+ start:1064 stop:1483 length:420 start_codon:yes stop_codon:yes gene_type:complete
VKNPLSKKNQIIELDCPNSLILAPGSKVVIENSIISLNKDYSISCYYLENEPEKVVFKINYNIKLDSKDLEEKTYIFEFWAFLTDKKESSKLSEFKFEKNIISSLNEDNNLDSIYSFQDQLILNRSIYEDGLKIFLSLN